MYLWQYLQTENPYRLLNNLVKTIDFWSCILVQDNLFLKSRQVPKGACLSFRKKRQNPRELLEKTACKTKYGRCIMIRKQRKNNTNVSALLKAVQDI